MIVRTNGLGSPVSRVVGVTIAAIIVLMLGVQASAAIPANGSDDHPVQPVFSVPHSQLERVDIDPKILTIMKRQWAEDVGVSIDVADQAFAATGPLLDFQQRNASDPRFGAVWTSFGNGKFKVHVRYLDESFRKELDQLRSALAVANVNDIVETSTGGASHLELMNAVRHLTNGITDPIPFRVDSKAGLIETWGIELGNATVMLKGVINEQWIVSVSPPPQSQGEREAGAGLIISGGSRCTVGYFWRTGNSYGFVTAGHCRDNSATLNPTAASGTASGVFYERCPSTGEDFQIDRFDQGAVSLGSWSYSKDDSTAPWPTFPFGIAGGFYETQPTWKVGLSSNSTRSTGGTVLGYESSTYTGVDCSIRGTLNGMGYTNLSNEGDSGGPVFTYYNGGWYIAAIHNSGPTSGGSGTRVGTFIGSTSDNLPSGAYICRAAQHC